MSSLLKEKLVYIGHLETYERGSEIAKKLLDVETNDTAIYRLTDSTAEKCADLQKNHQPEGITKDEILCVEVDGSMISTREDSWRELKLGRMIRYDCSQPAENQFDISKSTYISHLGNHKEFGKKMDNAISKLKAKKETMIFINDGAKWIENWINETYPEATQILDFYHAMKYVGDYLEVQYADDPNKKDMKEYWGHILKTQGVQGLIKHIDKEKCRTKIENQAQRKLLRYLTQNEYRMKYPEYKDKNLPIGSGAIESAHKTVIQRRMKLSGQRWSIRGAQNMLDLRCLALSGNWNLIENIFGKIAA